MAGRLRLIIGIFSILVILLYLIIVTGNLNNIPGIGFLYPTETGKYVVGQTFTTEEAKRIINISSHNFYVIDALPADSNNSHSIGWNVSYVTAAKFLDIAPDVKNASLIFIPRYRVLPVVVYNIGNPAYHGINLLAYVDPEREYVAYLGYGLRDGLKDNWTYTDLGNGIRAVEAPLHSETMTSLTEMRNLSISDTDIILPEDMSEQYKDQMIAIALNDSRVKGYLNGYNYEVYKFYIQGPVKHNLWGTYFEDYPTISFKLSDDLRGLFVTVDPHREKVVYIRPPY